MRFWQMRQRRTFLSTPSARRATQLVGVLSSGLSISIHALREEGDYEILANAAKTDISIHALREEGDDPTSERYIPSNYFYPRPPRGGRPPYGAAHEHQGSISIHALREEGDPARSTRSTSRSYFYPRPPRGGRRRPWNERKAANEFLSTPSARRATIPKGNGHGLLPFLSTPSARRATSPLCLIRQQPYNFYPRPPRGGRQ